MAWGGHAGGEQASRLAVQTLVNHILNTMPWFYSLDVKEYREELHERLKKSLELCDLNMKGKAGGTTLTIAYVLWPRMYVVHVGDSRCYLYRETELKQITTDHTMAQKMVEGQILTPEQAEDSKYNNILVNAIGGSSPGVEPELKEIELAYEDIVLLCSDGLNKHVKDEQISSILKAENSAMVACERLISTTNEAGSEDNVTVIVANFGNGEAVPRLEEKKSTSSVLVKE